MKIVNLFYNFLIVTFFIGILNAQSACKDTIQFSFSRINEGLPIGTLIKNYTEFYLFNDITNVIIIAPNNQYFDFNVTLKQLFSKIIFDAEAANSYTIRLDVTCTSSTKLFEDMIVINDINDEPALWTLPSGQNYYIGRINDNSPTYSDVIFDSANQPKFTDRDIFTNNKVEVIDASIQSFFIFEPTKSPLILQNNKTLDYDLNQSFNLTLILKDLDRNGVVVRSNNVTVIILVIDKDSKLPVFEFTSYDFFINNTVPKNSLFVVKPAPVKAVDGDKALNITINYNLKYNISFLNLDSTTGLLRINAENMSPTSLIIPLEAYQIDNLARRSDVQANIYITAVEKIVKFTVNPVTIRIEENKKGDLIKLNLTETIANAQFSIQSANNNNFIIESSGLIRAIAEIDYEKDQQFNLLIRVSDGKTSDTCTVIVEVVDVNEFKPQFVSQGYSFQPSSSQQVIGKLQATDGDTRQNLSYTLRNFNQIFNINESSGELYVINSSSIQSVIYNLTVRASDNGIPISFSDISVLVNYIVTTFMSTTSKPTTSLPTTVLTVSSKSSSISTNNLITTDKNLSQTTKLSEISKESSISTKATSLALTTNTKTNTILSTHKSSSENPVILNSQALIAIYVLVPLIILILIIFTIVMLYYKKRRIYKANEASSSLTNLYDKSRRQSYITKWDKSPSINEGFHDLYDLSGCERHISQLRSPNELPNGQQLPIQKTAEFYQKFQQKELIIDTKKVSENYNNNRYGESSIQL